MKKCKGCNKEIDKYAIACQYCGRLSKEENQKETDDRSISKAVKDKRNI